MRESNPRQVDKKSGGSSRRGVWNSQGGSKDKLFSPLHSLGLYNNNVSCLRTVSGKNLLANPINNGSGSSKVFTTSRHSFDSL